MTFWQAHLGFGRYPKPGELWMFDFNEPWLRENQKPVEILDVKDGWVRFKKNDVWDDERMRMIMFRWCYNFYAPQEEKK